jgi:hypothetical protein
MRWKGLVWVVCAVGTGCAGPERRPVDPGPNPSVAATGLPAETAVRRADGENPVAMRREDAPAFATSIEKGPRVAQVGPWTLSATDVAATLLRSDARRFQEVVNETIVRRLVEERTRALGVRISGVDLAEHLRRKVEEEIVAARDHFRVQYQMPLEKALQERGTDLAGFRRRQEIRFRKEMPYRIGLERLVRQWSLTAEVVEARRIVLPERKRAEEILLKLRRGASLERLARDESIGPFRDRGGRLPAIYRGEVGGRIESILFSMKPTECSSVLEEVEGGAYSIYEVISVQLARPLSYPEMEAEVLASLQERGIDERETNGWYHATIEELGGVRRFYDLPEEESP